MLTLPTIDKPRARTGFIIIFLIYCENIGVTFTPRDSIRYDSGHFSPVRFLIFLNLTVSPFS